MPSASATPNRAYLAEVLSAELDDRSARRIGEAKLPRLQARTTSTPTPSPAITPGQLARLATGAYLDNGEPVVLLGDSGKARPTCSSASA